jgi:hypothetical protein
VTGQGKISYKVAQLDEKAEQTGMDRMGKMKKQMKTANSFCFYPDLSCPSLFESASL